MWKEVVGATTGLMLAASAVQAQDSGMDNGDGMAKESQRPSLGVSGGGLSVLIGLLDGRVVSYDGFGGLPDGVAPYAGGQYWSLSANDLSVTLLGGEVGALYFLDKGTKGAYLRGSGGLLSVTAEDSGAEASATGFAVDAAAGYKWRFGGSFYIAPEGGVTFSGTSEVTVEDDFGNETTYAGSSGFGPTASLRVGVDF